MKYVIATLLMVSILGFSGAVAAQEKSDLPLYSKVYDDKRDPFKDAVAAIKLAKASNRNVLIEIGGNWCTWCHKMDAFLEKNPDIYNKLHQEFVILKVNVSDSNENEAFMKGLPPVLGYPHMYVSTAAGKMVLSKDTAELQEDGKYSRENWLSFIDQWKPKADELKPETEQIEPKA
ncbi:DUF255 domain-containing protein [Thalassotalea euphylliae]|uniref:DUF255 domain-containing protein n=1 Tax=Thalassotalea euphylliae TaxID=1655234 RepID=A0A3E0UB26_9GAMM|nr:thioredoxin family protein [Thalassotalea euphylliae]REL34040.1 DUF255 domain-containing protein [Thalassotalea euphylliae]